MKLADAMSRLGTETAFEVLARARALEAQGREIVHLQIGEPDFDTPEAIREAAKKAIDQGETHYGPSPGLPELRDAIARYVSVTRQVAVERDQVVVTPGGKPIMFYAILALCQSGDEVIYPNPGFPIYESMIRFVGAKAVPLPLADTRQFRPDLDQLASLVNPRTKLIILNSPQNPTGGTLTKEDNDRIAEIVGRSSAMVLSDEIYSRIIYEGRHDTIINRPGMQERTILLDGFSKTYAMTGWRVGYGVMPAELAVAVARLQTNSASCTNSFVQRACITALSMDQAPVTQMVAEFQRRRDIIVAGLNDLPGFRCLKPQGAFYVFPNVSGVPLPADDLARRLLQEAGVACLSGSAFGEHGRNYLRFSYANSVENIEKALERMGDFLRRL